MKNLGELLGKELMVLALVKDSEGLLMPWNDDQAPILTHEEAVTLAVLSDAMAQMRRMA